MLNQDLIYYVNGKILTDASRLVYQVSDYAPNTFPELHNATSLVVWSGASDSTIYGDKHVNWALRALHDQLYLTTGLDFTPEQEIELGRIQANQYDGILADLIYCEVAGQAEYYLKHDNFVDDQVEFTLKYLNLTKG